MKGKPAKPGIGSGFENRKVITSNEKPPTPKVGCGLPKTYFGNSRAIDTERGRK
jgi:hypothetical protein